MELNPLFFIAAMYLIAIVFVALIVFINDAVIYLIGKYRRREVKKARLKPNVIYHSPNNYPKENILLNKTA